MGEREGKKEGCEMRPTGFSLRFFLLMDFFLLLVLFFSAAYKEAEKCHRSFQK